MRLWGPILHHFAIQDWLIFGNNSVRRWNAILCDFAKHLPGSAIPGRELLHRQAFLNISLVFSRIFKKRCNLWYNRDNLQDTGRSAMDSTELSSLGRGENGGNDRSREPDKANETRFTLKLNWSDLIAVMRIHLRSTLLACLLVGQMRALCTLIGGLETDHKNYLGYNFCHGPWFVLGLRPLLECQFGGWWVAGMEPRVTSEQRENNTNKSCA